MMHEISNYVYYNQKQTTFLTLLHRVIFDEGSISIECIISTYHFSNRSEGVNGIPPSKHEI